MSHTLSFKAVCHERLQGTQQQLGPIVLTSTITVPSITEGVNRYSQNIGYSLHPEDIRKIQPESAVPINLVEA